MEKKFQDLDLSSAFLFAAALDDPEICRLIIESVLGIPISSVTVHAEHSILYHSEFRSIRLDIYAHDETRVAYDLEMQNANERNLARRSRFHQAEMDVMSLKPGQDFNDLRPAYVIFICTFDPFGLGLYRYTFTNTCLEQGFPLEDGATRIFLSTCGRNEADVPELLVKFLKYIENSTDEYVDAANDQTIRRIHERVCQIKKSREWEGRYMTMGEWLDRYERQGWEKGYAEGRSAGERDGREIGQKIGQEIGQEIGRKIGQEIGQEIGREIGQKIGQEIGQKNGQDRILQLMQQMIQAGEQDQLERLKLDAVFLEEQLEKYHL